MKKSTRSLTFFFAVVVSAVAFFLYFSTTDPLYRIPVSWTSADTPTLQIGIENKNYLVNFDTGSKFLISLTKEALDSVSDKRAQGAATWRDFKGNFYESCTFILPKIQLGSIPLSNVLVKEEVDEYCRNTTLWKDSDLQTKPIEIPSGTLGRPILEKINFLLDFKNSQILACNDKRKIIKAGILLNTMVQVPFEIGIKGTIILLAATDIGTLRLLVDTGATICAVRTSRVQNQKIYEESHGFSHFTSSKFEIGGKNFGSQKLFLLEITPDLTGIDGFLGMDFLRDHMMYIDYPNKVAYIG